MKLFPVETGPDSRLFFGQDSDKASDYYKKFDKSLHLYGMQSGPTAQQNS